MQIISVIYGDERLSNLNLTIPTDDFVERLNDFFPFFSRGIGSNERVRNNHAKNCRANWTMEYEVNLTKVLGPNGFCYTFNLPKLEKLYKLSAISQDFTRFTKTIILLSDIYKPFVSLDYPVKVPTYERGLEWKCELNVSVHVNVSKDTWYNHQHQYHNSELVDGMRLIFHDPFEMPTKTSHQYFAMPIRIIEFQIIPEMTKIDETMLEYSPEK